MADRLANKVLLIGWDAADWRMIDPMLKRGELPALASLMQRGTWGNLATIRPMLSPMLWTSIATGKRADKHGVLGFLEPKPDATGIRPVHSTSRTCSALWNIADRNGLRSCVVNWFASHPAEPVAGTVVSENYAAVVQPGVGTPQLSEGTVHPPEFSASLSRLLVDPADLDAQSLLPFVPRAAEIDQSTDHRLLHLATLLARAATVQTASRFALENTEWDLGCLFFGAIDEFGHHFMPFHPPLLPGVDPRDAEIYGQVMTGCYRFQDMMLQSLLEVVGEDTTVVIVSDHGFYHDGHRPGARGDEDPEAWHRPYGIAVMAGPGVKPGQRLYGANILDVTPTILHLLGLPIGADMDGRPWVEATTDSRPVQRVISLDNSQPQEDGSTNQSSLQEDAVASALSMRHLAEMGYINLDDQSIQTRIDGVIREQKINLARALTDSRRAPKAIKLWRELADAEPKQAGFRVELARCLLQADRPAEAIQELESFTSHFSARLLRVEALLKLHETQLAQDELRQLAEASPDNPDVLARLGRILLNQNEPEEAGELLRRAWGLEKQNPLIAEALSQWAYDTGDYDAAVDHALDAVSLAHHFPQAHYRLGKALAERGDREQAILAMQTCLQQSPHFVSAHRKLAALLPQGPDADRHALLAASNRPTQNIF